MDFIDWCDRVLAELVESSSASPEVRTYGIDEHRLAERLFGKEVFTTPGFYGPERTLGLDAALREFEQHALITKSGQSYRLTYEGQQAADDKIPLWQDICEKRLTSDQDQLLRLVNQLSPRSASDHVLLERIDDETFIGELDWAKEDLHAVQRELADLGFLRLHPAGGSVRSTYAGLVFTGRCGITAQSKFIDELVAEWETTSVEFKRQLETRTADQKAKLIKVIIGLANTKVSGLRWLIVGFDDRTRSYHGQLNQKITQDDIQRLMSPYSDPAVLIRYDIVDYRAGPVGKLQVLSDRAELPYSVKKSVGKESRIEVGDIFVRHGSLTVPPSMPELRALQDEAERAKGLS